MSSYDRQVRRGRDRPADVHDPARGEVAQLVEHTTENRSVASSILALATNLRSRVL